jgi:hypothetical protein
MQGLSLPDLNEELHTSFQYKFANGKTTLLLLGGLALTGFGLFQPPGVKSVPPIMAGISSTVAGLACVTKLQKQYLLCQHIEDSKAAADYYQVETVFSPPDEAEILLQEMHKPAEFAYAGDPQKPPAVSSTFQYSPPPQSQSSKKTGSQGKDSNSVSQEETRSIIRAIAANKLPTLFIGSPRTGKTMACRAVLGEKLLNDPNTQVFISACRHEPWFGWEKEANFQISNGDDILPIVEVVDAVFQIYKQRAETPQDERGYMPPIVLVLDDWTAGQGFLTSVGGADAKLVETKLKAITTNGSAVNVTILVTLHTANLEALKFLDSSTRSAVGLFVVGRIVNNPETGQAEGGYDPIWRVVENNTIFSPDLRQKISPVLAKKIKERDANGVYAPYPLALTKIGLQPSVYNSIGDVRYINDFFGQKQEKDVSEVDTVSTSIVLDKSNEVAEEEYDFSNPIDQAKAVVSDILRLSSEKPVTPSQVLQNSKMIKRIQRWANNYGGEFQVNASYIQRLFITMQNNGEGTVVDKNQRSVSEDDFNNKLFEGTLYFKKNDE